MRACVCACVRRDHYVRCKELHVAYRHTHLALNDLTAAIKIPQIPILTAVIAVSAGTKHFSLKNNSECLFVGSPRQCRQPPLCEDMRLQHHTKSECFFFLPFFLSFFLSLFIYLPDHFLFKEMDCTLLISVFKSVHICSSIIKS